MDAVYILMIEEKPLPYAGINQIRFEGLCFQETLSALKAPLASNPMVGEMFIAVNELY